MKPVISQVFPFVRFVFSFPREKSVFWGNTTGSASLNKNGVLQGSHPPSPYGLRLCFRCQRRSCFQEGLTLLRRFSKNATVWIRCEPMTLWPLLTLKYKIITLPETNLSEAPEKIDDWKTFHAFPFWGNFFSWLEVSGHLKFFCSAPASGLPQCSKYSLRFGV